MAPLRTVTAISKNIEAELKSVRKQSGPLHIEPKTVRQKKEFREEFMDDDGILRTTIIMHIDTRELEDEARCKFWLFHDYEVLHYLIKNSLDKSDEGFRQEMEIMRDKLRFNTVVFRIPERPETQRTVTAGPETLVTLGDHLCHEGALRFTVETSEVKLS